MRIIKTFAPLLILAAILFVGCEKNHYNLSDLPPTVKSFFTVEKTAYDIGEEIHFGNKSADADQYFWDFGDGTSSTDKDAVKVYTEPGVYTVKLRAIGPGGTGNFAQDITIIDPNQNQDSDKELYFIEYGAKAIKKISLEPGAAAEAILDISGKRGVGLAWDSVNQKIYYSDFENSDQGKIWRMNEDGSELQEIVSGISDPYSIALNVDDGKVYWADDAGNVSRANLDGSGLEREFIHIDGGQLRGIAYDSKNKVIYFYEVNDENLYAAKADGSGVGKIVEGVYGYSILVDEVNAKLYYEDRNTPAIMQSNLDGSGAVKIADVPGTRVHGMAIDQKAGKFYWADRDKGLIRRSNLDGSEAENFLSGLNSPRGIFIR